MTFSVNALVAVTLLTTLFTVSSQAYPWTQPESKALYESMDVQATYVPAKSKSNYEVVFKSRKVKDGKACTRTSRASDIGEAKMIVVDLYTCEFVK